MDTQPALSFITINYNGLADTCDLVRSLMEVVHSVTWEVVIVDNASLHDEARQLEELFPTPQVRIVRAPRNLGFAGGNNLGIQAAQGTDLMLINNDTFVEEDHFDLLIRQLHARPSIGAVCPKIRFAQGNRPLQYAGFTDLTTITLRNEGIGCGQPDRGQFNQPCETAFCHGAAVLFSRETLQRAGAMSELYFLYYEEMDWSMRIREAGLHIWYAPAQTVFHKESQTTGQQSPLRTYYLTRNRLLFALRNRSVPTRWLCYAYLTSVVLIRDIPQHIIHHRPALAKACWRGLWAFITTDFKTEQP